MAAGTATPHSLARPAFSAFAGAILTSGFVGFGLGNISQQKVILALKARDQLGTKPYELKKRARRVDSHWTSKTTISLSPSDVVVTSVFAVAFCMTLLTFQGCDLDFCPEWHTNAQRTLKKWFRIERHTNIQFNNLQSCPSISNYFRFYW